MKKSPTDRVDNRAFGEFCLFARQNADFDHVDDAARFPNLAHLLHLILRLKQRAQCKSWQNFK